MRRIVGLAWGAASHFAWYVSYRVEGGQRTRLTE
jgi:hypothetical protein